MELFTMKTSLALSICLCLQQAMGNIPVNYKVELSCDASLPGSVACLSGMSCAYDDMTCLKAPLRSSPDFSKAEAHKLVQHYRPRSLDELIPRAYSTDGSCGPSHGGLLCDPDSTAYHGTCCSRYGYCGNTDAYCGAGCQSGCPSTTSGSGGTVSRAYSPNGQCGAANGGLLCDPSSTVYTGTCCSSYGWCGSTAAYCGTGCQSGCDGAAGGTGGDTGTSTTAAAASGTQEPILGSPSSAPATGGDTTDGTCGAGNGNTVCGDWPNGACCSLYGFCGNTTAHCGSGCQSGPCTGAPEVPVPGPSPAPASPNAGFFNIVGEAGVPAMHAGLMPNGRVIFLDKVENYTQIKLPDGQYAYSAEYDPETNKAVGLQYYTNAFCSGGAFLADGRWVSLGGNAPLSFIDPTVGDGFTAIRYLTRSATDASLNGANWAEPGNKLSSARWYATAQTMPDSSIFVASGSLNGLDPTVPANNNPTYEILNADGFTSGESIPLAILEKNQPYYMYPFVHLLNDGNLFIFVSKSAEIFNVAGNQTVTTLPDLEGEFRTYPNTGGSVLLPLSSSNGWAPEIVICGGGAYQDITSPTDPSCGVIQPLSTNPTWQMESMPEGRGMVEGTLLPDGTVIWVNGCGQGSQGFGLATDPTLEALIYDPSKPVGSRFSTGAKSTIARLYHSVALLLLDGTLMVAGSNPVQQPVLTPVPNQTPSEDYVTEFRVEIYTPPYLQNNPARPTNIVLSSTTLTADGSEFTVSFTAPGGNTACAVVLYHGGYVTHSLHMNHRMLFLDTTGYVAGATGQKLTARMPPNRNLAQPGPYVIYVTCGGVPGYGQFVMVS